MEVGGEGVAEEIRRVWLWVHPAAAKEALREIWKACSLEGAPWVGNIEVRVYSLPLRVRAFLSYWEKTLPFLPSSTRIGRVFLPST